MYLKISHFKCSTSIHTDVQVPVYGQSKAHICRHCNFSDVLSLEKNILSLSQSVREYKLYFPNIGRKCRVKPRLHQILRIAAVDSLPNVHLCGARRMWKMRFLMLLKDCPHIFRRWVPEIPISVFTGPIFGPQVSLMLQACSLKAQVRKARK